MKRMIKIISLIFFFLCTSFMTMSCAKTSSDNTSADKISAERPNADKASADKISFDNASLDNESLDNTSSATEAKIIGSMELKYAKEFTVDYYDNGCSLITISGGDKYLLLPQNGLDKESKLMDAQGIRVIHTPINSIYLASTSVMDIFKALDELDKIKMTSTKEDSWSDDYISGLVGDGIIEYVGKYNAPDYEKIVDTGCDLVIENTMIGHKPEVKEMLERLGFPVMIEKSSYEEHPMGRLEWIKLYGLLCGKFDKANAFYDECVEKFNAVVDMSDGHERVSTAFFYISSNGYVNIRKPGDYISKMIEMSGGSYIFDNLPLEEDNALSTVNLQMEAFYEKAVDADCLIYNSTVIGEIDTIEDLIELNPLLADFAAVQSGNVYCTNQNMFQESTAIVGILEDFGTIYTGSDKPMNYLHKLK